MNTTQNIRYLHKKLEDVSKNVYCLKQYMKNNPGGGGSEGDYVLTSAKIVNALGYTPISNTHASNNITQTLINSWNGAVTNSHTHSNKNVLDATTASFTTTLKTKLDGLENYQLTSTKITTALGFTPMNSTHPASAVTSTKITSWDGKLDKVSTSQLSYALINPNGSLNTSIPSLGVPIKVLGVDATNTPTSTETLVFNSVSSEVVEPTIIELEVLNVQEVHYPNLNALYKKIGNKWIKIQGQEVL